MIGLIGPRRARRQSLGILALAMGWLLASASGATFVVSNGGDSGAGSFRQAIIDANAIPGLDTITFSIGTGPQTITLASTLPSLSDPVVIDATTQPGYAGVPLVELNGTAGGNNAGLRLLAGNSTVRGLVINRFLAQGILIQGPGGNTVQGNYIGVNASGTAALGNKLEGIWINGSSGNVVGGSAAGERNVISASGGAGIYVSSATNNVIRGNFIGVTAGGTAALGNNYGVWITACQGTVVGGASVAERNVIAGNVRDGIYVQGYGPNGAVIAGNFIGVSATGAAAVANGENGITLTGTSNNRIGGATVGEGNVISGNGKAGISIITASANNQVQGNYIGSDASGKVTLANGLSGIIVANGGTVNNLIGGYTAAARNIISGNSQNGIIFNGSSANTVAGNYIGVDVTGTNVLKNYSYGIELDYAVSNMIGGASSEARNVISGNTNGVALFAGAQGNVIQGNYVGTDYTGRKALPNLWSGVHIEGGAWNTIGGTGLAGNLLSGNVAAGVELINAQSVGNTIQGNKIGTDATGNAALPNSREGIYLNNADYTRIGGAAPGEGNLISGNGTWGMLLYPASFSVILGNYIGTATDGISPIPNAWRTDFVNRFPVIEVQTGCLNNVIGGSAPGAGNRIAYSPDNGIHYAGIRMRDGALNNLISGNAIFNNSGLGIDLGVYLVSPNDNCDVDTTPSANMGQNFPVLTQAVSGNGTGVRGTLNSTPNSAFQVQFFASPACGSNGYPQGQIYLGDKLVTTGNDCTVNFVAGLPVTVPPGYVITATATDSANNASEFSSCVPIAAAPSMRMSVMTNAITANKELSFSWTNTPSGFKLKQTDSLTPPVNWVAVTNVPATVGGNSVVTLPMPGTNCFYLLSFE